MQSCVMITSENLASSCISREILNKFPNNISLVMILPNVPLNSKKNIKRMTNMFYKASFQYIFFKFIEIFVYKIISIFKKKSVVHYCRKNKIKFKKYFSVESIQFISDLKKISPDYILSSGPSILTKEILRIPKRIVLNCHSARIPEYMGAANYFWMLLNNERYAYSSIQKMELQLDKGPILAEKKIKINNTWSAYRLNYEVAKLGGKLYVDYLNIIFKNKNAVKRNIIRKNPKIYNRGLPKRKHAKEFMLKGKKWFHFKEIFFLH